MARLTSDFANGLDVSSASESKVKMPSGRLFRAYATEGDDANSAAVESNEIDGAQPRQRPFSPGKWTLVSSKPQLTLHCPAQLGDIPPSANCEPELRAVRVAPLVQTQSASRGAQVSQDLYFPHCIRLPVCGGCCPSARLQCQATQVSRQNVSVLHLRYSARERRFRLGGVARVEVERHGRCACQCITRPADCGPGQLYRAAECRCLCPPTAQAVCLKRQRAAGSLPARFVSWNAASCQCECKPPGGVWRCAAGFWFDGSTCRLVSSLARSAPN